jgi:hypothetical protein
MAAEGIKIFRGWVRGERCGYLFLAFQLVANAIYTETKHR